MSTPHKNKTFATLLAGTLGVTGAYRFYLHGGKDFWGWIHAAIAILSGLLIFSSPEGQRFFAALPLMLSGLIAQLVALVMGLTPDEKWDAQHNPGSARTSDSGWFLAVILVLTFGAGAVSLIAVIARAFDLLYTGGSFG